MNLRSLSLAGFAVASSALLVGCPAPEDERAGGVFSEIAPRAEQVRLAEPTSGATAGASTASLGALPSIEPTGNGANELATFYTFTRQTFDGVNLGTAWVLALVNGITRYPTTEKTDNSATWGPWRGELSPAEWRLRVVRGELDVYTYVLEGRRAGEGEYRAVISGQGYAPGDARRGLGEFTFDNDAADAVDPARLRDADASGTVRVSHDLRALKADLDGGYTIDVEAHGTVKKGDYTVKLVRLAGGGGTVDISSQGDIDEEPSKSAFEDLTMKSKWNATGAGRADVTVQNGDIPASIGTLTMTECWGTTFKQVYYTDSAGLLATSGDEAACPLPRNLTPSRRSRAALRRSLRRGLRGCSPPLRARAARAPAECPER